MELVSMPVRSIECILCVLHVCWMFVYFILFTSDLLPSPSEHTDRGTLLNVIRNEGVAGGTDFNNCFDYLINAIKTMEDNTDVQVMFLTDGDGRCDKMEYFKEFEVV